MGTTTAFELISPHVNPATFQKKKKNGRKRGALEILTGPDWWIARRLSFQFRENLTVWVLPMWVLTLPHIQICIEYEFCAALSIEIPDVSRSIRRMAMQ